MIDERLKEIYEQHYLLVMDTAFKILQDYYLAQDICQDVFVRITSEQLDEMCGTPKELRKYLVVMAQNRAIDYVRSQKVRKEVPYYGSGTHLDNEDCFEILEKTVDQRVFTSKLFADLERYRHDWYEILVRVEVYNYSAEEISYDLGIPISLVRSKLCRAKKWIKKKYRRKYEQLQ